MLLPIDLFVCYHCDKFILPINYIIPENGITVHNCKLNKENFINENHHHCNNYPDSIMTEAYNRYIDTFGLEFQNRIFATLDRK